MKVLILGASGGVGSNLLELMSRSKKYSISGWSSKDLDLDDPESIFACDFSSFDVVINCAGHNQGTFRGFLKNSWQNQLSQIMVNYVSNIFLLKHYAVSRATGRYVWISSTSMDHPRVFHSTYIGAKVASKFTIDLVAQEAVHIDITECKIPLTKTNIRFRNFEGTKTPHEVDLTYGSEPVLDPAYVAQQMLTAIEQQQRYVEIS